MTQDQDRNGQTPWELAQFICEDLAYEQFDELSHDKYCKDAAAIIEFLDVASLKSEIASLKHDIERYVGIAAEQAARIVEQQVVCDSYAEENQRFHDRIGELTKTMERAERIVADRAAGGRMLTNKEDAEAVLCAIRSALQSKGAA